MSGREGRLLPPMTDETAAYWQACREGRLALQRCGDCGNWQFYPRTLCTRCDSARLSWQTASGRGQVETYTVVHVPLTPAYAADVPYVVALVRLQEGPRLMTNVIDCAADEVRIGMPVEVVFEAWTDAVVMPQFRPAAP